MSVDYNSPKPMIVTIKAIMLHTFGVQVTPSKGTTGFVSIKEPGPLSRTWPYIRV